ncbi:CwfJ C-terminus 1-domain-containing protein-like protein [Mariannaea sp. PMI_226]|nr:CwfJ C-terminus 1-domain-containing protein-like protein [Mariannaea sp. PMI_226]
MDGLDEFERSLAAEKADRERTERDREERHHRRHHHHHRHDSERERDRDRDRVRDRDRPRDGHRDSRKDRGGERDSGRERERDRHDRHRRHRDDDDDGHRHKRSRHSREDDGHRSRQSHEKPHERSHEKSSDPREDLPPPDDEKAPSEDPVDRPNPPVRDSWMTAPSSLDIDYVHRPDKSARPPSPKPEPKRTVHKRELNAHIQDMNQGKSLEELDIPRERTVDYTFGDAGSSWRMTKLRTVYTAAEESGRSVDDVAIERFGNLRDFDDAREEKEELERRKRYGAGYKGKEKPTGELYQQRPKTHHDEKPIAGEESQPTQQDPQLTSTLPPATPAVDQTALNRLRAQMMKAKLRRAPNAAQLEEEYNRAAALFSQQASQAQAVVLGVMDNRQLAGTRAEAKAVNTTRGRERGNVEENTDMTIEDMVREERRTKAQAGGEGLRLAERIAKDAKFDNDLEYMDENAEKLARRVHKSDLNLKNMAVNEFQKLQRILDNCPLCHHEDTNQPPIAPVISLGTRVFLTTATEPEVSPGGAVIAPIAHRKNLLECDDDEWEELRNFMKSLTRMYHEQGREVIFYENAAQPHRHLHAAMVAVPIPYEDGATAPAYFREAFLTSDEEWSQHRKIVDTGKRAREGLGRSAFRRSFAKEAPYFHAWFSLDGGLGHVVEDSGRWPKGDLFAREVLGGIVDAEPHIIKKQGRWTRGDPRAEGFKKGWRKFDWTRVLAEG